MFQGPWVLTKPQGAFPSLSQQLGSPVGWAPEAGGWPGLLSRGETLGSRKWSGVLCESRRQAGLGQEVWRARHFHTHPPV